MAVNELMTPVNGVTRKQRRRVSVQMDEMLIPLQCSGINVGRICWTTVECRSETDYGKKKRKKVEIKNRSKNIYTVN